MSRNLILNTSIESRNFISFCFPSNEQLEDKTEFHDWLERMIFLSEDLKWLLSITSDNFWKQVLYDPTWKKCLDSFLLYAPRSYDLRNLPEKSKSAFSSISKLFLLVIKRMSENSIENSDKKMHGELIYENFVFDAAKIFDICSIYYKPATNVCTFLEEIIRDVFLSQPK
uniref:Activating signal cointegrator 1 complex subunit 2 n=1 Tax=Hydra vulgaris TaxID=6087 RepID=T2M662_HYDVU